MAEVQTQNINFPKEELKNGEMNRASRKARSGTRVEMADHHLTNLGGRVQRRRFQHPSELPRSQIPPQNTIKRQYGRKVLSAECFPSPPEEIIEDKDIGEDPEEFYRYVSKQQQKSQNRRSTLDGRESAQSKRTSIHSGIEKTPKKQLSQAEIEFYDRLSTPKHVTPKKFVMQRPSRPQTERERVKTALHLRAVTSQRGLDLPFNDHWSTSKVERGEEPVGPPGTWVQDTDEPPTNGFDTFSGFTSLLGWDNKRHHAMEMEIMTLRKRLWHSEKRNQELNFNLSELSNANDSLQGDLRKVQQKSFNQMTKSAWTPLEDRVIQEVLQEIHHDLEEWADENCVESFAEIGAHLNGVQQVELLELCKKVADVTQNDLLSQFQWWEERQFDPVLLLVALVTHRMYSCVFNNEFLALGAVDEASMAMMLDVYRKLYQLDFKQAQLWRSQLMRIVVGTPQSGGRFDGVSSKLDISAFVKRHYDDMLDDFSQFPEAALLKASLSAASRDALLNCWTKAAELFIQLQTQVVVVQWKATGILRSTVNPRFVESHRSQAFPKGRNDGKPISLVISPMVTFFGNEDGENYQDWRAVCKATVLVIEEEIEEEEEEEEEGEGEDDHLNIHQANLEHEDHDAHPNERYDSGKRRGFMDDGDYGSDIL